MPSRTLASPAQLFRVLVAPAAVGVLGAFETLLAAFASVLHRRTRQPSVPPMSEEWLNSLDRDTGRHEHWR
jgi:hypothetical protein